MFIVQIPNKIGGLPIIINNNLFQTIVDIDKKK